MAAITPSTFDPLARYVNVRMQQGVPIVDADLNELDDIRKFELRAFLKWFVGDGVPDGNDGFRISVNDAGDDLVIGFGVPAGAAGGPPAERGLRGVGRMIVDGLDVIITADLAFSGQPLFAGRPGAEALAERLGVPTVAMPTVTEVGPVAVYLDVWETLVTADDDTGLLHTGLGVETCARMRRDWVVRARIGSTAPGPNEEEFQPGHSYSLLAVVNRRPNTLIRPTDVVDRRHRRLQLPPATLVEDVMGTATDDYRAGLSRPPISLREAVNALLRGELPMTPDSQVAPIDDPDATDAIARAFLVDSRGGVLGVFTRVQGDVEQVYATRLSLDAISEGFSTPVAVTSGVGHSRPSVAELPDGSLFVVYQSESTANADIRAKHGTLATLATVPEFAVAETPDVAEDTPFVVATGSVVTVFFHKTIERENQPTTDRWYFRRWSLATAGWVDTDAKELAAKDTRRRDFHAAVDSAGKIWAVINADGFWAVQLDPGTGTLKPPEQIATLPAGSTAPPFVLCLRGGGAWVFWQNGGIFASRFEGDEWTSPENVTDTDPNDRLPCAVEDGDGALWLIWSRGAVGDSDLFARRRDTLGQWGLPRQVVTSPKDDTTPFAVAGADTAVWLFWGSDRDASFRLYFKRIVTAV